MSGAPDIADYCRQIETYLCQKNEGHLIRVVGPSFEIVARWASTGVPIKVAFRGIDRCVERYYRKGSRRRPVKIDFCEDDVLDVFDEWRRATGVMTSGTGTVSGTTGEVRGRRGPSLPEHLQRVLLRLTNARATGSLDERADALIDQVSHELDVVKGSARGVRGEERPAALARLDEADAQLMALARASLGETMLGEIDGDVDRDLSAFRSQMDDDAFARARKAAFDDAVRKRLGLPTLRFLP
jgi:hypothetical protein